MTEPTDIDALIAEAREADAPEVHAGIIRRLANALEATAADLARAREVIASALEKIQPGLDHDGQYSTRNLIGARNLLSTYDRKEQS